ncbi:MAG TPA: hypothetical protein VF665_09920 [Longimicrobium sp.]|jgi:hypothetical protein|uniref:hypothetical protein n=1 Tax=Longimicrobium sp. TaxID=2029185 RepID=UPI002EDAFB0E
MKRTLDALAFAVVFTGGLSFTRPAEATMLRNPLDVSPVYRACCTSADKQNFCCVEGGGGCRINATGCIRV